MGVKLLDFINDNGVGYTHLEMGQWFHHIVHDQEPHPLDPHYHTWTLTLTKILIVILTFMTLGSLVTLGSLATLGSLVTFLSWIYISTCFS